jgi:type III restriction enzyme
MTGVEIAQDAFSLTAVTGAGKTVMAAAAFEALFHGDDEFDFDADPGAVVIWFSDDPSLNEQTRFRLMEASDRINHTDWWWWKTPSTVQVRGRENLLPQHPEVGQEQSAGAGHDPEELEAKAGACCQKPGPTCVPTPSGTRSRTPLKTLSLTLYLVLDEAHRGMGNASCRKKKAPSCNA